ncbi:MAG: M20/M25/M40 family metallo-hydrolase, partial [Chloroflexota bacterium]|nr:M20/M25/M40 family metallo-hydrolase [Chloroflexota bacterium]
MLTLRRLLSVPARRYAWSVPAMGDVAIAFLTVLLIAGATLYAAVPIDLPRPVPASASPTIFSSERALGHIRAITRKPHPMGSPANAAVRDDVLHQLAALGLQPGVQIGTAVREVGGELVAGTPENIVALLPGTASGKAVMLAAHYDSVPTGPGASDDGAGVGAMLETARALTAGPPLRNHVIFLFTDGDEVESLGARAFVEHHPWARDIGVVLNVEARGNRGAARLFETSDNNGWLIREFAQAVPYPIVNSGDDAGYKLSGSDTDLSIFMEAGLPGLNVAYLDGLVHYHSALDTVEELDERSLQHLGSSVLALTRQFGTADLDQPQTGDAVYFSVLRFVVHYPVGWAIPLMACIVLLFAAVAAFGWRRRQLTIGGVAFGFVALLLTMVVTALVVYPLWTLIRALHPGDNLWALQYQAHLFWAGFACLAIAVTAALYNGFRRR